MPACNRIGRITFNEGGSAFCHWKAGIRATSAAAQSKTHNIEKYYKAKTRHKTGIEGIRTQNRALFPIMVQ
jgi:hypothetical protein